ncbi:MAG: tripartite tricarboxylate transporter substrate binding protein [Hyphomicrobiales bacterium]|nr:tripartite tricarboxylate transporter substrate binding protein [Hyphomicrobiales bacterium]
MVRILTITLASIAMFSAALPAAGQQYPVRPITLVVPLPPGGSNDILARIVGDHMSRTLGQQMVIENRAAGGGGTIATRQVARANPDGYTILLSYTSTFATGPSIYKNVGYDVRKDFTGIGMIAAAPSLVLVNKDVPVKNIPELIAYMRKSGEPFQYGAPGIGTVNHLAAEMFGRAAKVKVMVIPYKGSNPLNTDLIGGHVKLGFNPIPVSRGAIESGLIRALAVTSMKRSSQLPDLPTLAEQGLSGFDVSLRYGLSAPAGTPPAIIERLNRALNEALADEAVIKRIRHEGAEPMPTTAQQYTDDIDREETRWSAAVREIGLTGN